MFIYDASMEYQKQGTPLVIIAGKEYGTGSSRDWAAKGTLLLGVRAVIAEIVRANPPLEPRRDGRAAARVHDGDTRQSLGLTGFETFDIEGSTTTSSRAPTLTVRATAPDGTTKAFKVVCAHRYAGGDELLQ